MGQESSLELTGQGARQDERAPGGYEVDVDGLARRAASTHDYPITPKEHGTAFLMENRHLWLRSQRQHAVHPHPPRGGEGRARLPRRPGLHARGHADLHARRLRGHDHAVRRAVFRRGHRVPHPERPALQRGHRGRPRQGLLLRPDVPRREVEDAPAPHRVLDGRAGDGVRAPRGRDDGGARASIVLACVERGAGDARGGAEDAGARRGQARRTCRRRSRGCTTTTPSSSSRPRVRRRSGGATSAAPTRRSSPRPTTGRWSCTASRPRSRRSTWSPTPSGPELLAVRGHPGPRGLRRDRGRRRAHVSDGELLLQRIHEHQLPEEAFRWYLDLRRYGSVPHAGFGMGIERVVTWICGLEHLRETIAFPRMLYRIYP